MISAGEAAKMYRTTIGYVYKLASLHKWRKIRHQRRTFYNLEDVDKSLGG